MDLKVIYKNARCAVLEIEDGGTYETSRMYRIYLNGGIHPGNRKSCHKYL